VGLIGIGLVGAALAQRWLERSQLVIGNDLSAAQRATFQALGGQAVETASEVFQRSQLVVLSLPDSQVVDEVLAACRSAIQPGTWIIDTTTGDPADTVRRAAELARGQVRYVDATLVGSSQQIKDGTAVMLVGGDDTARQRCHELFAANVRACFLVGPSGAAARMKLIVNLVLGLHRAVLAEGLALGTACGFSREQTLAVLQATSAYSAVMDTKGKKMIARDYTGVQARLAQHAKDVACIRELGDRVQQPLPLTTVHQQLLQNAIQQGYAEADNSAILEAFLK
jgi:3-hydroxyisobutyrate dehydrogenase-like beta-hydroxyacid dehydrogenase